VIFVSLPQSDEMIFEATVRDPSRSAAWNTLEVWIVRIRWTDNNHLHFLVFSELYGSTVVLRQLTSSQAKRRGRRALEVIFVC
jgi:hypothetical protein